MTPEQFVYWLRGFCELQPSSDKEWSKNWHPDGEQWAIILKHLDTVFTDITSENNQKNALKAAEKTSKKVMIKNLSTGNEKIFKSMLDCYKQMKISVRYLLKKLLKVNQ